MESSGKGGEIKMRRSSEDGVDDRAESEDESLPISAAASPTTMGSSGKGGEIKSKMDETAERRWSRPTERRGRGEDFSPTHEKQNCISHQ